MTNPFTLFDVPLLVALGWAIAVPHKISLGKLTPEQVAKWRPRIRPIAIAVLILFTASCFLFQWLVPKFPGEQKPEQGPAQETGKPSDTP